MGYPVGTKLRVSSPDNAWYDAVVTTTNDVNRISPPEGYEPDAEIEARVLKNMLEYSESDELYEVVNEDGEPGVVFANDIEEVK